MCPIPHEISKIHQNEGFTLHVGKGLGSVLGLWAEGSGATVLSSQLLTAQFCISRQSLTGLFGQIGLNLALKPSQATFGRGPESGQTDLSMTTLTRFLCFLTVWDKASEGPKPGQDSLGLKAWTYTPNLEYPITFWPRNRLKMAYLQRALGEGCMPSLACLRPNPIGL